MVIGKLDFKIRVAQIEEVAELNELIRLSARQLSKGYYTEIETQSLIEHVFGVDTNLVLDQTYFVVEDHNQRRVACGGWSRRKTLFGGDHMQGRPEDDLLNPAYESAKIRAFFVHPDYAKMGVGRSLLQHCELEAGKAGFKSCELMSTLPGIIFYEKHGYYGTNDIDYEMPNGVTVKLKPMSKEL